jgi:hypothetical protein
MPSQKPKPKELGFLQKGGGGQGERMRKTTAMKKTDLSPVGFMWFNQTTNATQAGKGKIVYCIKFLSP